LYDGNGGPKGEITVLLAERYDGKGKALKAIHLRQKWLTQYPLQPKANPAI